jgi:hypothetical protein
MFIESYEATPQVDGNTEIFKVTFEDEHHVNQTAILGPYLLFNDACIDRQAEIVRIETYLQKAAEAVVEKFHYLIHAKQPEETISFISTYAWVYRGSTDNNILQTFLELRMHPIYS